LRENSLHYADGMQSSVPDSHALLLLVSDV